MSKSIAYKSIRYQIKPEQTEEPDPTKKSILQEKIYTYMFTILSKKEHEKTLLVKYNLFRNEYTLTNDNNKNLYERKLGEKVYINLEDVFEKVYNFEPYSSSRKKAEIIKILVKDNNTQQTLYNYIFTSIPEDPEFKNEYFLNISEDRGLNYIPVVLSDITNKKQIKKND